MKSTIYVLKYNNYFNRRLLKEDTLESYLAHEYIRYDNINFVPNDGISTSLVLNIQDYEDYDYLLNVQNNVIVSRWFIVDSSRTRENQYKLTLKRDSIADYYDDIKDDSIYVEKAMLPLSNPLIFNEENMSFNQIKKAEFPLKDSSGCAWICGYVALPKEGGTTAFNIDIKYDSNDYDIETSSLSTWEFSKYVNTNSLSSFSLSRFVFDIKVGTQYIGAVMGTNGDNYFDYYNTIETPTPKYYISTGKYSNAKDIVDNFTKSARKVDYNIGSMLGMITKKEYDSILALDGKRLKDTSSNTYYNISVVQEDDYKTQNVTGTLKSTIDGNFDKTVANGEGDIVLNYLGSYVRIVLSQLKDAKLKIDLKQSSVLEDAPYMMFCIPYGDSVRILPTGADAYIMSKSVAMNTAISIAKALGSEIYDVQLLPYNPMDWIVKSGTTNTLIDANPNSDINHIKSGSETIGLIYWSTVSNFTKTITKRIFHRLNTKPEDNVTFKVNSSTQLYRLCSPNYNGYFDWNPRKNNQNFYKDGTIAFNVDCTYKPYTPYIHVCPIFNNYMYGSDFRDSRGLICGGDFSLTIINDSWSQYQITNKNYQNIFDRDIQHLDFTNDIAKTQDILNAISAPISGITSGAVAGSMMGGGVGAGVGALSGAVMGAGFGVADYFQNQKIRKEGKDYKIDMYNYQLGNIKAQPYSLTKVSSQSYNYKTFPFIEFYDCTDEERLMMRHKIEFEGMTVKSIYRLGDFSSGYFKGTPIRLTNITNNRISNDIYNEIQMGIYLGGE